MSTWRAACNGITCTGDVQKTTVQDEHLDERENDPVDSGMRSRVFAPWRLYREMDLKTRVKWRLKIQRERCRRDAFRLLVNRVSLLIFGRSLIHPRSRHVGRTETSKTVWRRSERPFFCRSLSLSHTRSAGTTNWTVVDTKRDYAPIPKSPFRMITHGLENLTF